MRHLDFSILLKRRREILIDSMRPLLFLLASSNIPPDCEFQISKSVYVPDYKHGRKSTMDLAQSAHQMLCCSCSSDTPQTWRLQRTLVLLRHGCTVPGPKMHRSDMFVGVL